MCDTYNGWSNYQTWVFNLWFDDYFTEDAEAIWHNETQDRLEATYQLSSVIESVIEEFNPIEDSASVWTDLMGHAIGMIDTYEIAEHYIDELIAEGEYTE